MVVKPQYGNQGRGVTTNLSTREQVVAAFAAAREEGTCIMVEKFAPGADYRLLVVGERMVAAARREAAQVIGDGRSTIRQLVDEVNRDPRRGDDHATVLSKISLDPIALTVLAEQGFAARLGAPGRDARGHPPQRQPEHRRHGRRRHRAGPSRRSPPGRSKRPRSSGSTLPASTSWPATSAARWKSKGA